MISFFSHAFSTFIILYLTMETFNIFPFMQYIFLDVKHSVGAGINTLMSIFDGTGPSVLFRNMEKARPMR